MKGRTNISGGGMNIHADTENFTVASGSNVTAGNFVQYKNEKSDRKYDTNTGYGYAFYDSGNEAQKVLPCGNNKYVRRYKNNGETNVFWFNLVDVSDGFRILSSFSISSDNLPSFCLLDDGNIAICYMAKDNTFTVRIYNIETVFLLLNALDIENENIGEKGITHITQLGNSKIVANKMNECLVMDYSSGNIAGNSYINLGIEFVYGGRKYDNSQSGDNDWNIYAIGEDKVIIFPSFYYYGGLKYTYSIFLLEINNGTSNILQSMENYANGYYGSLNKAIWGNSFGINGNVLFSNGTVDIGGSSVSSENIEDAYETKIYYVENDYIMQSSNINLFEMARSAFEDLDSQGNAKYPNYSSSGTAQYVKENVFYVAVRPYILYVYRQEGETKNKIATLDSNSRTAIFRIEYDPISKMFTQSNIVTFEGELNDYKFGYGQFFESQDGSVYYLYETQSSSSHLKTGRWLMKLTYKNGNFTGSGAAIGVAKQSGKAGDVIEVYTPKV